MRLEYALACTFFGAAACSFAFGLRALRSGDDVAGALGFVMGLVAVHAAGRLVREPEPR